MSDARNIARGPTGVAVTVIPGYSRMNKAQRDRLLTLREEGQIGSRVYVRQAPGEGWRAWSERETVWLINRDGSVDRIAGRDRDSPSSEG